MIYAKEFLGKDSTVIQGTYTLEISGILKSLRVGGKRRKTPIKKEKPKRKEKRKKSKRRKRRLLLKCRWQLKFFII
uniref:Uncharacterized protein n=1 Tax=Urocitellus parryii TaxID=9999 RepID=A0A8D2HDJ5_UROPR